MARRLAKAELWEAAHRHHSLHLLSAALGFWAATSLTLDPEERAWRERAALLRGIRLMSISLKGWKARVERWVVKRDKERTAEAHRRASVAMRAMAVWATEAEAERGKRDEKKARLKGLRDHLGRLKAGRVLWAWIEIQNQAALERFQVFELIPTS